MKTQNSKQNIRFLAMMKASKVMSIMALIIASITAIMVIAHTVRASGSTYDFSVIEATSDFYVNDFAGLFTDQQKSDMMEKAVALDKDYGGIQVVVTTVKSLADCASDGKSHDIYDTSYAMYKQYGIGRDDMGILILFSSEDRQVYLQTGYKMQTYITDSKSGQLLDNYGMDYFVNDEFADGLISLQNATIAEIKSLVPQDWNAPIANSDSENVAETINDTKTNNNPNKKSNGISGWLYAILLAFVAMVAGFIATIKSLFSFKSRAKTQKEEFDKELQKQKKEYEQKIYSLKNAVSENSEEWRRMMQQQNLSNEATVSSLKANIHSLEKEVSETREKLSEYEEKYERIKTLHPNVDFDKEVYEMRENEFKASAQKVDEKLAHYVSLPADKDNIEVFSEAIRIYDATISDVHKYMTTDIEKIRSLYEKSVSLKKEYERAEKEKRDRAAAQKAFESISSICSGIYQGNYKNYDVLNRAYRIYSDLSSDEKGYFPDMQQIHNLEALRRTAEADLKDFNKAQEAEKEVRRIVDRIYTAEEDDRDNLNRAMRCYRNLSNSQQKYFDDELLRKLKRYIDDAESDHRRKEEARRRRKREEEERRRRMNSSSFSSSSSHSHHSGHGGRPSAGGAGRSF